MTAPFATLARTETLHSSTAIAVQVMAVLRSIRPAQADGRSYGEATNLTDVGFSSLDMVKVMLGVEAAFDLMIPQDLITPENFQNGAAITAMIGELKTGR